MVKLLHSPANNKDIHKVFRTLDMQHLAHSWNKRENYNLGFAVTVVEELIIPKSTCVKT